MSNIKIIAGIVFALFALFLSIITPTVAIAWMLAILLLTIYLFAFEVVDVDEAAITIMVI